MGVQLKDLIDGKEVKLEELKGKKIAVDASMWLYQFISSIRAPDGSLFTDSNGRVTSHLIGLSARIPKLIQAGIKLVFVFDGPPPELKFHERARRQEIKTVAESKYKKAKKKKDIMEMRKYAVMTSKLTPEMVEDSIDLIKSFGIPVIKAKSEAEAQAAYMVKKKDVYAIASNDYDSFLFGATRIVRNLNLVGKRKKAGVMKYITVKPEIVKISDVLNKHGIDQEQMIVIGMLIGTDYNVGGIKGVGPKGAIKLVKEYKNDFDALFEKVEWSKYFDYPWTQVFYLIRKMPVKKDYSLNWKNLNEKKLNKILVKKHNFSKKRVERIMSIFAKEKEKQQQKGLGDWVK